MLNVPGGVDNVLRKLIPMPPYVVICTGNVTYRPHAMTAPITTSAAATMRSLRILMFASHVRSRLCIQVNHAAAQRP